VREEEGSPPLGRGMLRPAENSHFLQQFLVLRLMCTPRIRPAKCAIPAI